MLTLAVFLFSCCTFSAASGISKCDSDFLSQKCKNLLKRNDKSECHGEALQLFPKCLYMASECKNFGQITDTAYIHSANANFSEAYNKLFKKVKIYRGCFSRKFRRCNESKIKKCYDDFNRNSTEICRDVHRLRLCVLLLQPRGCHEMRNPWYTIASGILKRHKSCFIQNYSIVLEILHQKNNSDKKPSSEHQKNYTTTSPITCIIIPGITNEKWTIGYKFFAAMFVCLLVIITAILLFICVKRNGLPRKSLRGLMPVREHQRRTSSDVLDVRQARTCASTNGRPLTFIIDDEEAPPPYASHEQGFLIGCIDSPPPYTSRPTSVNGDFV